MGSDENKDELNIWIPEHVLPGFRTFATNFYWECWGVAEKVLQALALGLGLQQNFLSHFHSGHRNELTMRHYPSVHRCEFESKEKARLGAHSDMDSFTLLFQDDCGGLEVENPDQPGDFFPAAPLQNTLVMNIGDVMMSWSNGTSLSCLAVTECFLIFWGLDYLRSTIHRVQPPALQHPSSKDSMTRERYSIPYFVTPKLDTVMEALPGCFDPTTGPKHTPETYRDYLQRVCKDF